MNTEALKSYTQWAQAGRVVLQGSKAEVYAISPDGQLRKALFSIDQTEELPEEDYSDWDLKTADEIKGPPAKPKIKLDYDSERQVVAIWCGRNKKAIKMLKEGGYRFEPSRYRWVAKREDIDTLITKLSKPATGFDVEAKVDGEVVTS